MSQVSSSWRLISSIRFALGTFPRASRPRRGAEIGPTYSIFARLHFGVHLLISYPRPNPAIAIGSPPHTEPQVEGLVRPNFVRFKLCEFPFAVWSYISLFFLFFFFLFSLPLRAQPGRRVSTTKLGPDRESPMTLDSYFFARRFFLCEFPFPAWGRSPAQSVLFTPRTLREAGGTSRSARTNTPPSYQSPCLR